MIDSIDLDSAPFPPTNLRSEYVAPPNFVVGVHASASTSASGRTLQPQPLFTLVSCKTKKRCVICIEPIGEKAAMLKCLHSFHQTCISQWLTHKKECPVCRTDLGT